MATANPISSSCQSIATVSLGNVAVATSATGGSLRTGNGNGNTTHYVMGTGSLGRLKYHNKHKSLDASDEELEYSQLSQSTHILGRVKSERFLASKVDEDRRRRTIIVEKKNDSFGFTLQSYGIHYKKDQEVEMITYVDYVEYDGPAYRAGMREGDVILSINGRDMEKADHKTLVDYIKSCDTRMRMVVLFEDCVRKVELHMRYIQLQNMLQNKMNELEKICIRERELLEGKWKTHSLPARKKATTSPTDGTDTGNSPTDAELNLPYYRSTLSTEDVTNIARQTQQTIIPPPAQFMLSYHYFDPHYRYVMKPSTSTNSSGDCFVTIGEPLTRAESGDTTTAPATSTHFTSQRRASSSQPPAPPPRTCEKHKPPNKQQQQQQQQHQPQQQTQQQQTQKQDLNSTHKSSKTGKHCHGHSCNPCIDFRWKSAEKSAAAAAAAAAAGNGDNVSLDAYDLASPCCDTHCVPSRRRTRHHHKEHTHKHKHRDRDREHEAKERPPRPKSQSHVTTGATRHHHHHHAAQDAGQHQHHYYEHQQQQQQQQQQSQHHHHQKSHGCDSHTGSIRSRYFDIASGLASRCSLHSCTSSEFAPADSASYTTSISTDTLFYDPNSENPATSRQHSTKSRQSCQQQQQSQQQQAQQQQQQQTYHHSHHQHQHHQQQPTQQQQQQYMQQAMYQQRYHITATQVQPAQIYPNSAYVHKPKSWDNLTAANIGAYGYGYGYLDTVAMKPVVNLQIAQQRHSIPRKNPYGRYSTYTDVENYAPPPTEFVEQVTTTTTTITAKSTEELIATSQSGCDCMTPKQHQQAIKLAQLQLSQNQQVSQHNNCQMGYYSHLAQPKMDATTSTSAPNAPNNVSSVAANVSSNANSNVGTSSTVNASGGPNVSTVTEVTRL
ncbi:GATA zinc finger domain-containing protein 10 [Lucilia sericata]|uniref:GATA zinc finger domain-containing protein 10 n=1 Tax=Lucilia sericata TaxID=13632 RepID=UPI0018A82600|nr:GATA zinc finger domain-containing protein 10 [Lucilia sericata]XP_037809139.1 GATA zinc finger domain-containing protein 10 [Lucilia sericata]